MDGSRRAAALARQAAEILPGPPSADDLDGARAWADLVRDTAARLAACAGGAGDASRAAPPAATVPRRVLTAQDLLDIAAVGHRTSGRAQLM